MKNQGISAARNIFLPAFSFILRFIALAAIFLSGTFTSYLLFALSNNPWSSALGIIGGPLLVFSGIALSLPWNANRPALLRIEVVFGLYLSFIMSVFGSFSIGGYLYMGLIFTLVPLLIDAMLWQIENRGRKSTNINLSVYAALIPIQLIITMLIFFIVQKTAPGFLLPITMIAIPWNGLLFLSIRSYLPDQSFIVIGSFIAIFLAIGFLSYAKYSEPDFWATITRTNSSSGSSGGGSYKALGSESGSTGSENITLEYQTLNNHNDSAKFKLNDRVYMIEPKTRTVFYGLLEQSEAQYVNLSLKNGSVIKALVKDKQFVVESKEPNAQNLLVEISLLDKNNRIITTEKVESEEEEW